MCGDFVSRWCDEKARLIIDFILVVPPVIQSRTTISNEFAWNPSHLITGSQLKLTDKFSQWEGCSKHLCSAQAGIDNSTQTSFNWFPFPFRNLVFLVRITFSVAHLVLYWLVYYFSGPYGAKCWGGKAKQTELHIAPMAAGKGNRYLCSIIYQQVESILLETTFYSECFNHNEACELWGKYRSALTFV